MYFYRRLLWNLTGGVDNGVYVTDVTNASRTQLMDLETLEWSPSLLNFFELPLKVHHLAKIVSCSEIYGKLTYSKIKNTSISGCMGDQQAALVGQNCFRPGQAKVTFGTGCFLVYNVGAKIIHSDHLVSTVAYKLGPKVPPVYALEGSIGTTTFDTYQYVMSIIHTSFNQCNISYGRWSYILVAKIRFVPKARGYPVDGCCATKRQG